MKIHIFRSHGLAFLQVARRLGSVLLCALMLAGALLAVGRDGAQADTSLSVGISPVSVLDPVLSAAYSIDLEVTAQIYDTLVSLDPAGTMPGPGIAQSWVLSPDGKTWTFTIRPGLKFHDGTDLDAAAVLTNLNRWWDPASPYHPATFPLFQGLFGGFKGDPNTIIASLSSPAANQVQIALNWRFNAILAVLANPQFAIVSPAALAAGTVSSQPVGSGPYKFSEWTAGDHITLLANSTYWAGVPQIGTLTFKLYASDSQMTAALAADQVQNVPFLGLDQLPAIAANPALRAEWRSMMAIGYLGMNLNHAPLNNPLVRQAIAHAINKSALIAGFYNPGDLPADQYLPPALVGYKAGMADYGYDPVLAHNLLVQSGYQNAPLRLSYRSAVRGYLPRPADTAVAIQQYLQAIGLNVTVEQQESGTFLNNVFAGNEDLYLLGWGADYPHPTNFMGPVLCSGNLAFGTQDATLCGLVAIADLEPNPATAKPLYENAEQRIHDYLPMVPLAYPMSLAASRHNVAAYVPSPVSDRYGGVFYASFWGYLPAISK